MVKPGLDFGPAHPHDRRGRGRCTHSERLARTLFRVFRNQLGRHQSNALPDDPKMLRQEHR